MARLKKKKKGSILRSERKQWINHGSLGLKETKMRNASSNANEIDISEERINCLERCRGAGTEIRKLVTKLDSVRYHRHISKLVYIDVSRLFCTPFYSRYTGESFWITSSNMTRNKAIRLSSYRKRFFQVIRYYAILLFILMD